MLRSFKERLAIAHEFKDVIAKSSFGHKLTEDDLDNARRLFSNFVKTQEWRIHNLYERDNFMEDIKVRLNENYYDTENVEFPYPDEEIENMAEEVQNGLGNNDSYFECFWDTVDCVIEDKENEYKEKEDRQ